MSYCRFSTDDFRSDIYCYESIEGYQIHVAAFRYVLAEPMSPKIDLLSNVDVAVAAPDC